MDRNVCVLHISHPTPSWGMHVCKHSCSAYMDNSSPSAFLNTRTWIKCRSHWEWKHGQFLTKTYPGINMNAQKFQCCRFWSCSHTMTDSGRKKNNLTIKNDIIMTKLYKVRTGVVKTELRLNSTSIHRQLLNSCLWSWFKAVPPFPSGKAFLWLMNVLLFDSILSFTPKMTAEENYSETVPKVAWIESNDI